MTLDGSAPFVKNRLRIENAKYRRSCLVCGAQYTYHPAAKDKGHEHKRGLFCSQVCRSKHITDSKPGKHSKLFIGTCATCNAPIVARYGREYCTPECRPSHARLSAGTAIYRACNGCGEDYVVFTTNGMPSRYCSDACRTTVANARKRTEKSKRKARLRGATVENVDPFVVFERDGWRCQLCGDPTPKEKRGTRDAKAPELDHIIPIARGGEHSYSNTQCACRTCNNLKRDNVDFEAPEVTLML